MQAIVPRSGPTSCGLHSPPWIRKNSE
jgi:hypothetical protein